MDKLSAHDIAALYAEIGNNIIAFEWKTFENSGTYRIVCIHPETKRLKASTSDMNIIIYAIHNGILLPVNMDYIYKEDFMVFGNGVFFKLKDK